MTRKWQLTAALTLTLAAPAMAKEAISPIGNNGWDETHWGMDVDQVLTAQGGTAKKANLKNKDAAVFGQPNGVDETIQMLGYSFAVEYHFTPKPHKLSIVRITSEERAACTALEAHFMAELGEGKVTVDRIAPMPDRAIIQTARDWETPQNDNLYSFTDIRGEGVDITYCQIFIQDPTMTFEGQR